MLPNVRSAVTGGLIACVLGVALVGVAPWSPPLALAQPRATAVDGGARTPTCDDWIDRIYRKIGIPCPSGAGSAVRDCVTPMWGSELVELTPATGVEQTLWACGSCSAPARYKDGVVVRTANGLTFVAHDGSQRMFAAPSIVRAIGTLTGAPDQLLVVVADPNGEMSTAVADFARGELTFQEHVPCAPSVIPDQLATGGVVLAADTRPGFGPRLRSATSTVPASTALAHRLESGGHPDMYRRMDPIFAAERLVVVQCRTDGR
jgi:hypothetical protein